MLAEVHVMAPFICGRNLSALQVAADAGGALKVWRIPGNILNKQS
jgi:hypothetical protein